MPYPKYWNRNNLLKLTHLYNSGLSMREVGLHFYKSEWAICSAMKRNNIKRRNNQNARHFQFINTPSSFTPKKHLNSREIVLKTAGLMLYWAEGGKRGVNGVDFANSDPTMIALFLLFLRTIYNIRENKLRVYLYSYPNQSVRSLIKYWSKLTSIHSSQFSKPYIRSDGGTIHDKMKYGLIHIRYHDKKLLQLLIHEIDEYVHSWDGGVVKHTSL